MDEEDGGVSWSNTPGTFTLAKNCTYPCYVNTYLGIVKDEIGPWHEKLSLFALPVRYRTADSSL